MSEAWSVALAFAVLFGSLLWGIASDKTSYDKAEELKASIGKRNKRIIDNGTPAQKAELAREQRMLEVRREARQGQRVADEEWEGSLMQMSVAEAQILVDEEEDEKEGRPPQSRLQRRLRKMYSDKLPMTASQRSALECHYIDRLHKPMPDLTGGHPISICGDAQ
jgi:hypothetical protein